mmetsp:Transcript_27882/g.76687  ORF Transcript_27882/g.76687 Transcript_27882/m.76687 type:complete len:226 (-) Transcript_27882:14-691(-)
MPWIPQPPPYFTPMAMVVGLITTSLALNCGRLPLAGRAASVPGRTFREPGKAANAKSASAMNWSMIMACVGSSGSRLSSIRNMYFRNVTYGTGSPSGSSSARKMVLYLFRTDSLSASTPRCRIAIFSFSLTSSTSSRVPLALRSWRRKSSSIMPSSLSLRIPGSSYPSQRRVIRQSDSTCSTTVLKALPIPTDRNRVQRGASSTYYLAACEPVPLAPTHPLHHAS